jgi:hypothetical protein
MIKLHPHRWWFGLLVFSVFLYVATKPVVSFLQDREQRQVEMISAEYARVKTSFQQLEDDIATVQKLSRQMSAEDIEKILAPVDRLKVATMLEHQAAASRLQNFAYTIAPEQKLSFNTPGAGSQMLAQSEITLAADVPLDADAYAFVEHLRASLPGRGQLRALTIERIGESQAALAVTNLHMTARIDWLSAGSDKTVVGGL